MANYTNITKKGDREKSQHGKGDVTRISLQFIKILLKKKMTQHFIHKNKTNIDVVVHSSDFAAASVQSVRSQASCNLNFRY